MQYKQRTQRSYHKQWFCRGCLAEPSGYTVEHRQVHVRKTLVVSTRSRSMYSNTATCASYCKAFDVILDTGVESFAFSVRTAACIIQQLQGCSTIFLVCPHKHAIKCSIIFCSVCTLHTRRVAGFGQIVSQKKLGQEQM